MSDLRPRVWLTIAGLLLLTLALRWGCGPPLSSVGDAGLGNDVGAPDLVAECPGCNLVLLTFDALRADRLGVYGYPRDTSPQIDAFARDAAVFLRNLSQSPTTLSSVPSFLTSKYARADKLLADGTLRDAEVTLAERLRDAGYRTLMVSAQIYAGCEWGACAGFDAADEDFVVPESAVGTRDRALAMLERRGDGPFFLWVHFRHPHAPYDPSEEVFRRFYDGPPDGLTFYSEPLAALPFERKLARLVRHHREELGETVEPHLLMGRRHGLTPGILTQLRAMYDGTIRTIDTEVGVVLDELRATGLLDESVVMMAADHGEGMGESRTFDHNVVLYGVLHTPLIVRVPGAEPTRIERPVMNVDILPTALRLLGVAVPSDIRGRDLFAPTPDRPYQYAEGGLRTVVKWPYKLVGFAPDSPDARLRDKLFDLESDPTEQRDLARRQPEVAADLRGTLERIYAENLALDPDAPDTDIGEKLRALGYVE